jgi:hypothetical protein
MSFLFILGVGFCATAISSGLLLGSRKVQSALGRVAIVQASGLAVVVAILSPSHRMGAAPILIFWSGALLAWFGVRSHLESSILLRMLHMLRRAPMTKGDLTSQYESYYGQEERLEELRLAGLLTADPERASMTPTRKGLLVARLVLRLR